MSQDVGRIGFSALRRRLLSGGAWAVGGRFGSAIIGLTTNAILARVLSPEEFGAYFLALSIVSFGATFGCLGLNGSVVRFVAESMGLERPDRARRTIRLVVTLGAVGALVSGGIYLLVGDFVGGRVFDSPALVAITGLLAGWIALSTMQELFAETFRGFHDIKRSILLGGFATGGNSAGLIMRGIILLVIVFLWIYDGQTSLTTIVLVTLGSAVTTALISGWVLRIRVRSLVSGEGETLGITPGEVLQVSAPMLVNSLTVFFLMQSDIWILGAFGSQEEVAIYGAASRFVALVTMPLFIVNAVLPPIIAELYARGEKERLERTMRPLATLTGIPSLLALGVMVLAGGPILGLVYGSFYSAGALVLAILCLGKLTLVWSGSCGLTLQMTGNQTLLMWISILCGVLFALGALWAVQDYGATGVATVAALSVALQSLLTVLAAKKRTGIWTHVSFSIAPVRKLLGR